MSNLKLLTILSALFLTSLFLNGCGGRKDDKNKQANVDSINEDEEKLTNSSGCENNNSAGVCPVEGVQSDDLCPSAKGDDGSTKAGSSTSNDLIGDNIGDQDKSVLIAKQKLSPLSKPGGKEFTDPIEVVEENEKPNGEAPQPPPKNVNLEQRPPSPLSPRPKQEESAVYDKCPAKMTVEEVEVKSHSKRVGKM